MVQASREGLPPRGRPFCDGKMVPNQVVEELQKLACEGARVAVQNGTSELYCTQCHSVEVPEGWIPAKTP